MSTTHGALVIIGSGPGIGSHVAHLFASKSFSKVVLLSRDSSRLSKDAEFVRSASKSVQVDTQTIDLSNTSSIPSALAKVDEKLGGEKLEVVLFNAARVMPSKLLEWKPEDVEVDLRIAVLGCYAVAQWAVPKLLKLAEGSKDRRPAFLVTSGSIYKNALPEVFSLSTCKAAQHNMVESMHKEFKEKGVYCGMVVVGGVVADENPRCNAKNIANETWKLYTQQKSWDLEVEIVD